MTSKKKGSKLKAVDFFCCAGGVTHGFRNAGIKVLGGIDIEGAYKETYEKNNKGSKFIQADIATLQPEDLIKKLKIKPNMDNLIFVGCSPCQYFTIIKTSKEKSEKTKLLLEEFQRFVEYFKPGFVFIENVPGLEKKEDSPLSRFKDFLTDEGYVFDDDVINAANYNVPQSRRRYVLLASRVTKTIEIPEPVENKNLTVRKAIGTKKFARIKAGQRDDSKFQHTCAGLEPINIERLKLTPANGGTRKSWKDYAELQLACYAGKDNIFTNLYSRMYWDKPSPTITTKFYSISNGRFAHPTQNRAISLREGATLQSFPLSYHFEANSIGLIARMIGNAVPPKMAECIGRQIVKNNTNGPVSSKS